MKRIGFQWYNGKWWISSKKLDLVKMNYLTTVLKVVDMTSPTTSTNTGEQSSTQSPSPAPQAEQPKETIEPKAEKIIKNQPTEDANVTKWTGFPVNKNIYAFVMDMTTSDGDVKKIKVQMDRDAVFSDDYRNTMSKKYRRNPKYIARMYDHETNKYLLTNNYVAEKEWGTYNEDEKILDIQQKLQKFLEAKEKSKTWNSIDKFYDLQSTPEELKNIYINNIFGKGKNSPENEEFSSRFKVTISNAENPEYNGEYPVFIHSYDQFETESREDRYFYGYEKTIFIDDNLEKLGYKNEGLGTLGSFKTYRIKSIQELENKINELLNSDEVQKRYLNKLKSFPFLESQKSQGRDEIIKIRKYIANPEGNVDEIFRKLQDMSYVRPSQRKIKGYEWVLNSKTIVNDVYSSNFNANLPNFFFTALAYFIHRELRGISSWTDIMLTSTLRIWMAALHRFDLDLKFAEVQEIITNIGRNILKKYWNNFYSENQRNEDFRESWERGDYSNQDRQKTDRPNFSNSMSALEQFKNFAEKFGIDPSDLEEHAKKVYYTILKSIHPDLEQDPAKKDEKTKMTQDLNVIWDKIPEMYKKSSTWYDYSILKKS